MRALRDAPLPAEELDRIRVYLPPDTNCPLSVADHCLRSRNYVNVDGHLHVRGYKEEGTTTTPRAYGDDLPEITGWTWPGPSEETSVASR
jgi:phosphoketolase